MQETKKRLVYFSHCGANCSDVNSLTIFGFLSVTAMVICYSFEKRNPLFILGFSLSCICASIYGFLQGVWPFGIVEAIWSLIALKKWRDALKNAP